MIQPEGYLTLRLASFAAQSLSMSFDFARSNDETREIGPELSYRPAPARLIDGTGFVLEFDLTLGADTPGPVHLDLKYYAWFQVEGPLPNDLVANDFVMINAPAIAYPYLRAYVSQLTLISGVQPVLLPVVNFVELAKTMRERLAQ